MMYDHRNNLPYFVDHNTKTTTFSDPRPPQVSSSSVKDFISFKYYFNSWFLSYKFSAFKFRFVLTY